MNEDANSNRELTFEIEENNVIPTRVEKITRFIKKKKYKTYFTILEKYFIRLFFFQICFFNLFIGCFNIFNNIIDHLLLYINN